MIRILFLGDIVGEPGRNAVMKSVPVFLKERGVDFVIANGENAAGGRGITGRIAIDLLRSGVTVITTGDHIWDQRETASYISTEPRLLRPINYPNGAPGQGSLILETAKGKVAVLNLQGRTFMQPILDNPFPAARTEVERLRQETPVIIVDMHAETTSEKIAMGRFLDGKVSAVFGTHTHVQTADERIFPGGTAFICDVGMCGPDDSCLGRDHLPIIKRFIDGLPGHFPIAAGPVRLCGVIVEVDEASGKALRLWRVNETFVES
jgi:metallophosphoesterase (TIGR00282 family)